MIGDTDTIHTDVSGHDDADFGDDTDVDAFLSSFKDDEPKKKASPSEDDEGAQDESAETAEEPGEKTEGESEEATDDKEPDPEDQEIEVKVNGETKKATLRELKRLYGQESALTQRSQKLAETQREVEVLQTRAGAALKAMLDKATERNTQYADWGPAEWAQLAVAMTPEDYKALKDDASRSAADVKFLETELDGHIKAQRDVAMKAQHEQAVACIKTLQDATSPHHIEGFDKGPYEEMMTFAESQGLREARSIVSPAGLKLVHMAMQFARQAEAAKSAEKKVKQVRENPTRVLKPGSSKSSPTDKMRDALKRMRSGDDDAGTDAFLASF